MTQDGHTPHSPTRSCSLSSPPAQVGQEGWSHDSIPGAPQNRDLPSLLGPEPSKPHQGTAEWVAGTPKLVLPLARPLLYIFLVVFKKLNEEGCPLGSGGCRFSAEGRRTPPQPLLSSPPQPKRGLAFVFPLSSPLPPPFLCLIY